MIMYINKLSKLQRRAVRVITSSTYDIRSSQILKDLNWKPIEVDLKNRETVMTFKALTGQGPDYLQQLFTECNNDNYSLRSYNTKLALPKPRTNFLKRTFSYRAAKSWNELSNDILKISASYQSTLSNGDLIKPLNWLDH